MRLLCMHTLYCASLRWYIYHEALIDKNKSFKSVTCFCMELSCTVIQTLSRVGSWCCKLCAVVRDLDGTAQSLKAVELEKEELHGLTTMLQKSLEVLTRNTHVLSLMYSNGNYPAKNPAVVGPGPGEAANPGAALHKRSRWTGAPGDGPGISTGYSRCQGPARQLAAHWGSDEESAGRERAGRGEVRTTSLSSN